MLESGEFQYGKLLKYYVVFRRLIPLNILMGCSDPNDGRRKVMMRTCIGILSLLLVLFLSGCASTQETSEPAALKQPALEAEQTKEPTRVPAHVDLYPAAHHADSGDQV